MWQFDQMMQLLLESSQVHVEIWFPSILVLWQMFKRIQSTQAQMFERRIPAYMHTYVHLTQSHTSNSSGSSSLCSASPSSFSSIDLLPGAGEESMS